MFSVFHRADTLRDALRLSLPHANSRTPDLLCSPLTRLAYLHLFRCADVEDSGTAIPVSEVPVGASENVDHLVVPLRTSRYRQK